MLKLSSHDVERVMNQEHFYTLRALKTPSAGITLARWLIALGLIFLLFLFMPWQQNVRGKGKVIMLDPSNRPQTVQAVIAGQIQSWHIREGMFVNRGDTIVTIREVKDEYFDPLLLTRLQEQLLAKRNSLSSKRAKANALGRQIVALRNTLESKIEQARARLEAERVKYLNAQNQFQRNKRLYEAGNIPLTKFQEIEYKYQGSEADYENAQTEINRLSAEYQEKISKAESDLNNTRAEIFETEGEISKMENEYANMEIRSGQYQIIAPQDGYVVRAMKAGIGETIKAGEAVCTIMPDSGDMAVEMYVKAMNVPLISEGRNVRIEFDGWPALQFSGWPSVSVGTFGGVVEAIDFFSTRPGEFRVLVVPDRNDVPWPEQLRVGSGTQGWVMLDNVPIWYEIWRQINGFPPSIYKEPLEEALPKNAGAGNAEEKQSDG